MSKKKGLKTKTSLRIGMIGHKRIPSREGGVEIVVEEISKRLVARGHSVTAYNRGGQHVSGSAHNVVDYDAIKEYEGIKIVKVPTIDKKGLAAMIYALFASIRALGGQYDVLHYHAEGPCAFLWIPSLFGIRTVATIHGLDWQRSGKWGSAASAFIKFGEKMAAKHADEVIVLSRRVQQYFKDTYGRDTRFVPNGVNRPEKVQADIITDKWGLNGNDYYLSVSRLTREKRVDLLIQAFRMIDTEKKLVIAGGSSDTDDYVKSLHELADGDSRIIFTDFVQGRTLQELYSNAYVYCLPSELEGMPISLLEAMSYGNCCLVSDIAENRDVIDTCGFSFETNNMQALADSLQRLENEIDEVNKCKEDAADFICRRYNWDEVVDATVKLYRGTE